MLGTTGLDTEHGLHVAGCNPCSWSPEELPALSPLTLALVAGAPSISGASDAMMPCYGDYDVSSYIMVSVCAKARRVPGRFLGEGRARGALPAAPELPFSPRTEELFSSLSGWNVSALAP